jgi:hypothetical protein
MRRLYLILLAALLLACSSSPVRHTTTYSGGFDPTYNFKGKTTVGLVPFYWTSKAQGRVDKISELKLLNFAKHQLERRGYSVYFMKREDLIERDNGSVEIREGARPDLTFTAGMQQQYGGAVSIPGQSVGISNWGAGNGNAYQSSTSSYQVNYYTLWIGLTLYSTSNDEVVWTGSVNQTSSSPDIDERMESMVRGIFYEKWN